MNEIEKKYIELVAIERISTYNQIAEKENITEDEARKEWTRNGGIDGYIAKKLGIDKKELKVLKENSIIIHEKEEIDRIRKNLFVGDRQVGFDKNFNKFYNWYITQKKKQNNCCYYCKISENDLKELFDKRILKSKKFTATFHIERLDSEKNYIAENMVFACSLCNNAKSDMISEKDFEDYFASPMYQYLQSKINLLKRSS